MEVAATWRWKRDGGVARRQKDWGGRRVEMAEGWRWQNDVGVAMR